MKGKELQDEEKNKREKKNRPRHSESKEGTKGRIEKQSWEYLEKGKLETHPTLFSTVYCPNAET